MMRLSSAVLSLLIGSHLVCRLEALPTSKSVWRNHDDGKKQRAQSKASIRGGATNKMMKPKDLRFLPTHKVTGPSRRLEDYEWWCEDGDGWYYLEDNEWYFWGNDSDCPVGDSGLGTFDKVPTDTLTIVGDNGEPSDQFPLAKCEGDCDSDNDCMGNLICSQRSGTEGVPGCKGSGSSGKDYCADPSSNGGGGKGGSTGSGSNTESSCPRPLGTEACPYLSDVIIVGAGSAGLVAANDLKTQGMSITILEASSGYGGRVQKVAPFGFYMDVGASWVGTENTRGDGHVGNPNDVLSPLVNRNVDVSGYTRRDAGIAYHYEDGGSYREDFTSSDYRWIDYTYWDFLNDQVVQPYRLQDNIVNRCEVNYIWYDNQYAWAVCADGRVYEAYNIIVTVSMAILQQNSIQFEPQLPSNHLNAISNYVMGPGLKVALEFRAKFYYHTHWKDGIMFFDEMNGHNIPNKHVLTCFIYGITTFQGMSNSAIVQELINELNIIYRGQASSQYTGNYYVKHWTNEPYVRAAYVEDAPTWAMRAMQQPVGGGTLHFAGEAIPVDADGWGYVHGAGQSGKRAAYEVRTLYCNRFPGNC